MKASSEAIRATEIGKQYRSRKQMDGYWGLARGIFSPRYEYHQALDGISLTLN